MSEGRRFVIGDIHGCVKTFRNLMNEILHFSKRDTLYLLGDYIDRGPGSKGVLDDLMKLKEGSFSVFPLMGNHEYMMLQACDSVEYFELWQANGCATTLLSFGIHRDELGDPQAVKKIPGHYFTFLESLDYFKDLDDFFLVHAGLGNVVNDPMEDIRSLLWTRTEIYDTDLLNGKRIVHGHTPRPLSFIRERIADPEAKIYNLDAGCVYNYIPGMGNLAALDLDTMELLVCKNLDL
jgi:serine/threonine protein phosphatase 1